MAEETVILLRVTRIGARERSLADELERISSYAVAYIVDGRSGSVEAEERPVIALTDISIRSLGMHLTTDYPWRCGDYGLYLATSVYPSAVYFWIIEGDVRISGANPESFFHAMESTSADFLAGHLEPATESYFWRTHGQGRGAQPTRCLFSTVRISARLATSLQARRKRHSGSLWRRAVWPNDEVFVATSAVSDGFKVRDFNDVNGPWYSTITYDYYTTIDGNSVPFKDGVNLLHSVKWLSEGEKRSLSPQSASDQRTLKRFLARRIIRYLRW